MTLPFGHNFRATLVGPAGFTGDPAGTFFNGSTGSASGADGGVSWSLSAPFGLNTRDRSSVTDERLAGLAFVANDGSHQVSYTYTLPAPGSYIFNIALGDQSGGVINYCQLFDNATLLATIANGTDTLAGNNYVDANGNVVSAATWTAQNPVGGGGAGGLTKTFASTSLVIVLGSSTLQSSNTAWAALSIATAVVSPPPFLMPQILM